LIPHRRTVEEREEWAEVVLERTRDHHRQEVLRNRGKTIAETWVEAEAWAVD